MTVKRGYYLGDVDKSGAGLAQGKKCERIAAESDDALAAVHVEPHRSDVLRCEYDRQLKGMPRDIALEIWGPQIEAEIEAVLELQRKGNA